jgi:hypothetical protein
MQRRAQRTSKRQLLSRKLHEVPVIVLQDYREGNIAIFRRIPKGAGHVQHEVAVISVVPAHLSPTGFEIDDSETYPDEHEIGSALWRYDSLGDAQQQFRRLVTRATQPVDEPPAPDEHSAAAVADAGRPAGRRRERQPLGLGPGLLPVRRPPAEHSESLLGLLPSHRAPRRYRDVTPRAGVDRLLQDASPAHGTAGQDREQDRGQEAHHKPKTKRQHVPSLSRPAR